MSHILCTGIPECASSRRRKCVRPSVAVSPWKSAYIRQHRIENNWRKGGTREPMVHSHTHTDSAEQRLIEKTLVVIKSSLCFSPVGAERSRWSCDHVSPVQRRPDRQRLRWQHTQSLVGHHWQGKDTHTHTHTQCLCVRGRHIDYVNCVFPLFEQQAQVCVSVCACWEAVVSVYVYFTVVFCLLYFFVMILILKVGEWVCILNLWFLWNQCFYLYCISTIICNIL